MNIIVDGYNFIRCTPLAAAERRGLEEGRVALCQWFADLRRARGHDITIVFDGGLSSGPSRSNGINIEYAPSADAEIAARARPGLFVISSDRAVQRAAEKAGAVTCSSEEFWRHAAQLLAAATAPAADVGPAATGESAGAGGPAAAATSLAEAHAEADLEEDWTRALDDPRLWALAGTDAADVGSAAVTGDETQPGSVAYRGGRRLPKRGKRLSRQESRRRAYLQRL